ncbi:MAG: hypothetical protein RLN86_06565 [Cyclobacteriaceae bacterium]
MFWFFNALNKDYSTNLKFPVNFNYDKARFIPVDPLPDAVFMNVSGNGWDLLRKSLGMNLPYMNITLERPTEVKKIVGSTLPALLAGQLGSLQINHVVTDTLYLSVDQRTTKKVMLAINEENLSFADGFERLSPIVVLPDSVEIEGPQSLLELLTDTLSLEVNEEEVDGDYRRKVPIITDNDLLVPMVAEAEVLFEVVEWEEMSTYLTLEVENSPTAVRLNLVKDTVACQLRVPKREIENFNQQPGEHRAVLDLTGLRRGDQKLLPKVEGLPSYVRVVRIDSVAIRLY